MQASSLGLTQGRQAQRLQGTPIGCVAQNEVTSTAVGTNVAHKEADPDLVRDADVSRAEEKMASTTVPRAMTSSCLRTS